MRSAPPEIKGNDCLDLVIFRAGNHQVAVIASQVRSSGVSVNDQAVEIESILGLEKPAAVQARQILTIKGDSGDSEISVAMPIDLCSLPAERIHPLPEALKARCRLPGLKAIAMTSSAGIPIIDLEIAIEALHVD